MVEEPADSNREDNLWDPVDDDTDYGAHGNFDDRARDRSYQLWLTTHRRQILSAVLVLLSLAVTAVLRLRGQEESSEG